MPQELLEKLEKYSHTIQTIAKLTDALLSIMRELPTSETEDIFELTFSAEAEPGEFDITLHTWKANAKHKW